MKEKRTFKEKGLIVYNTIVAILLLTPALYGVFDFFCHLFGYE